jgi:hypothetical protein
MFQQSPGVQLILVDPQNFFIYPETQAKELRKKHGRKAGRVVVAGQRYLLDPVELKLAVRAGNAKKIRTGLLRPV